MAEVRILYIATSGGLVQLANPGKSDRWREIGRALDGQDVRAVAASPSDPLLAFACGAAGIERTENGGAGWERVYDEATNALVFDGAGRVLAGTQRGALLASIDGREWNSVGDTGGPIERLVAPPDAAVLTVGADGTVGRLEGETWRRRDAGVPDAKAVAVQNQAPHELFVAGATALRTPRGSTPLRASATGALLLLGGTPAALLLGTHDTLLRSEDDGATLQPVEGPRDVTALVSPQRAVDQVFAGTASGELWYSADRGRSWSRLAADYSAVHGLAFARAL